MGYILSNAFFEDTTVKLYTKAQFACEPTAVWELFNDPEFDRRMDGSSSIRMTLMDQEVRDGVEIKRWKCESKKELPSVMARAIGSSHLTYTQITRLDRAASRQEWEVIPDAMAHKVTARGVTEVRQTSTGAERVVTGEVKVRVPFVGSTIEKVIANEFQSGQERAAEIAQGVLSERGGAPNGSS